MKIKKNYTKKKSYHTRFIQNFAMYLHLRSCSDFTIFIKKKKKSANVIFKCTNSNFEYIYIYIYIYQSQMRISYDIKITQESWYLTATNNRIDGKENTRIVIEIKTKTISNSCILLYNIKSLKS